MTVDKMRMRGVPRTDRILAHPSVEAVRQRLGADVTKALVREALADVRKEIRAGAAAATEDEVAERVRARSIAWLARRTRKVVNATGVVLHTNLGRAPLGRAALAALAEQGGYLSLEVDLATGARGGRAAFVEASLAELTGAAAALVVNNNAAAVLLALASVAAGRGVVVSRGELVEIGGGFRVPEVLARSGARLIEVGTTNRTRADDYARALDEEKEVAAILRVHPGNFRQNGFVARPSLAELVALGRARGVAVIEDLGGGALVDLGAHGLGGDPLARESVAAGADLVTFSTDKILGGPQGGALVGSAQAVDRARRDPLARALRIGRLPLVALEATLAAYLASDLDAIPALAMVRRPLADVRARAAAWSAALCAAGLPAAAVDLASVAGGGTYAEEKIPSAGVLLRVQDPERWIAALRQGSPPVFARIEDGAVAFDARTVLPGEDEILLEAIRAALRALSGPTPASQP
jgi:L-seryl-tRNA(Ser) seleniumtransferase